MQAHFIDGQINSVFAGMSVAAGKFYSNRIGFAAGAPRDNGTGRVIIVPEVKDGVNPMKIHAQLSGEQFASSFGYELAAADINGDKYEKQQI